VVSGGVLEILVDSSVPRGPVRVLGACRLHGRFAAIKINRPGLRAVPTYSSNCLSIRIQKEHS
jgi:hypothetical protein